MKLTKKLKRITGCKISIDSIRVLEKNLYLCFIWKFLVPIKIERSNYDKNKFGRIWPVW